LNSGNFANSNMLLTHAWGGKIFYIINLISRNKLLNWAPFISNYQSYALCRVEEDHLGILQGKTLSLCKSSYTMGCIYEFLENFQIFQ